MTSSKNWILAIRPKTLSASAGPVILGFSLAHFFGFHLNILIAVATLLCALLLQISTNLINDYYDGIRGTDTHERIGPVRVTQNKLIDPSQVKNAFILTLFLSFLIGIFLMIQGGLPIILIGISSLVFAYIYTGGPFPLSHYGLGELLAYIFFGPVAVWGTFYLQTGENNSLVLLAGSGPGFISAALMAINNMRDQVQDKKVNKHTVAVVLGENASRVFVLILILLSMCIPYFFYNYTKTSHSLLVVILTPFIFMRSWQRIYSGEINSELNLSLAATGKYMFVYCLFFSIALINNIL